MYKYMKKACRFHKSNKLDLLEFLGFIVQLFVKGTQFGISKAHKLHRYKWYIGLKRLSKLSKMKESGDLIGEKRRTSGSNKD